MLDFSKIFSLQTFINRAMSQRGRKIVLGKLFQRFTALFLISTVLHATYVHLLTMKWLHESML